MKKSKLKLLIARSLGRFEVMYSSLEPDVMILECIEIADTVRDFNIMINAYIEDLRKAADITEDIDENEPLN